MNYGYKNKETEAEAKQREENEYWRLRIQHSALCGGMPEPNPSCRLCFPIKDDCGGE
jgi:hypothetical protein